MFRSRKPWFSNIILREMRKKYLFFREPWFWLCLLLFSTVANWRCATMTLYSYHAVNVVPRTFTRAWVKVLGTRLSCSHYFAYVMYVFKSSQKITFINFWRALKTMLILHHFIAHFIELQGNSKLSLPRSSDTICIITFQLRRHKRCTAVFWILRLTNS